MGPGAAHLCDADVSWKDEENGQKRSGDAGGPDSGASGCSKFNSNLESRLKTGGRVSVHIWDEKR